MKKELPAGGGGRREEEEGEAAAVENMAPAAPNEDFESEVVTGVPSSPRGPERWTLRLRTRP